MPHTLTQGRDSNILQFPTKIRFVLGQGRSGQDDGASLCNCIELIFNKKDIIIDP